MTRRRFLIGIEASELGWFTPAGTPMTQDNWDDGNALALGVYLDGSDDPDTGPDGGLLVDDDFLVLVNAWWEPLEFAVPAARAGQEWVTEIDSFDPGSVARAPRRVAGDGVTVGPRSVMVLRGPSGFLAEAGEEHMRRGAWRAGFAATGCARVHGPGEELARLAGLAGGGLGMISTIHGHGTHVAQPLMRTSLVRRDAFLRPAPPSA